MEILKFIKIRITLLNSTGKEYAIETKTHPKPDKWSRVMSSAGDQSCSDAIKFVGTALQPSR